jgi:hypothetical protein
MLCLFKAIFLLDAKIFSTIMRDGHKLRNIQEKYVLIFPSCCQYYNVIRMTFIEFKPPLGPSTEKQVNDTKIISIKNSKRETGMVVHSCNPRHSRDGDQENSGLKPVQTKKSARLHLSQQVLHGSIHL